MQYWKERAVKEDMNIISDILMEILSHIIHTFNLKKGKI